VTPPSNLLADPIGERILPDADREGARSFAAAAAAAIVVGTAVYAYLRSGPE
jgi:hypothetical protein